MNNKYLISTDSVYEGGRFDGNYNWKHFTKSGDVATFIARFQPNAIGDGYIRFSVISSSDSSIIEDTVTAKIYPPQETPGFDIVLSIISITLVMSLLRFSNKEK